MNAPLRVRVLGLDETFFVAEESFFQRFIQGAPGHLVRDPPPFIAPCTDGALILYNVSSGPLDVRGAYVIVPRVELETGVWQNTDLSRAWAIAHRPVTIAEALAYFKFPPPNQEST